LFIWRLNPPASIDTSCLNIDFKGGTAYTGQLKTAKDIGELRTALQGGAETLPDLAIEQIFTEFRTDGKSKLFTVRTEDKDADHVQDVINKKLGDQLERIDLTVQLDPPAPPGRGKAPQAILRFEDPQSKEVKYASKGQVERILTKELEKIYGADAVKKMELYKALSEAGLQKEGSYSEMRLALEEPLSASRLKEVLDGTAAQFHDRPQPERLENFDSRLAQSIQRQALWAILLSWIAILLYLWFRFGSWTFGAATVLCLIHDLFFTLGIIAACHYLYVYVPWLAHALGLSDFKIDLQTVAALLTLVGYSVSDTIVVFDRIREVRGKNPLLTPQTINDSVNQTLSRTILSSVTVWLVVLVLYIFGGEGVHLFAFVMIVGVIVGTYSSIYIASPLLLIFGEGKPKTAEQARQLAAASAQPAGAPA
jgi:SecD/SecF fusion protein